ncbi:drug resistance transporter, EmrB/QacA subfamily [Enterococcus malodoratus]|uniref:MDR family MFS transporter n=1 Tax=Enterococcus malodoratus TaxID=71451 RepID=UPI0008C275C6|nr:MDR family MFS transporter [Enterococcus malodoratus]SET71128.1 drug resistance transporter, EmrB/QacA subfamily [Enterococcus malodoratus]
MTQTSNTSNKLPKEVLSAAWAIALGAIAPMLDSTMVNIAIDQLTKNFHTTLSIIQWAITGYVLALAIAVPIAGWLMNRFDGKKIFIGAVILFGVTSVLAGISWNVTSFIVFRLLQGFTAGIITPLMSTLLVKTAGPENIGRVMAIVSTPMIFGPILGPVLGGFIVQAASWRWIFFINVFIILIAAPLMMRTLPNFEPFNRKSKLDIFGILDLSAMSAALIYGITKAADHATFKNSESLIWTGLGLLFLIVYIVYDYRKQHVTVLPLTIFSHRSFKASSVGLFFANIAIMGPMLILPLFFQNFRHFSAMEAAIALIPQGLGMLVTRPLIGKLIDKLGAKYVVIVSLIISLVGTIPLVFVTDKTSMVWIALILFIRGTSFGGINLPLTSDAYTGLADEELPDAGVGINIIENLGSSFGSAIIVTVVATVLQGVQPTITHELSAYHAGFLFSVIALALIFIPSIFLTNKTKSTVE